MNKPNLLIVGAQKSGTTSLHEYLSQHPDVFMSEMKELAYFSRENRPFLVPDEKDHIGYQWYSKRSHIDCDYKYIKKFNKCKNEKIVGESSAEYLYYSNTANDIYRFNPNMKIIIVLRNPVNRAFSAYSDLKLKLSDIGSFSEELTLENKRIHELYHYKWHFKNVGMYYHQVRTYLEYFPEEQIKIVLFENFISDSSLVMKDICNFLDIDNSFYEEYKFEKYNFSGTPKNRVLFNWINQRHPIKTLLKKCIPSYLRQNIKRTVNSNNLNKEKMNVESCNELKTFFRNDIEQLENMMNVDLSKWKGDC